MREINGTWLPDEGQNYKVTVAPKDIKPDGTFRADMYRRAVSHCSQYRTAIDVGAHVGTWTRLMAAMFRWVHAFEPWPDHLECFRRNVSEPNVLLYEMAVGDYVGTAKLETAGNIPVRVGPAGMAVEIATLDSLGLECVDFLKINCEGYDLAVLHGAAKLLVRDRPAVLVEQHHIYTPEYYGYGKTEALEFMSGLGAKLLWAEGPHYCFKWIS